MGAEANVALGHLIRGLITRTKSTIVRFGFLILLGMVPCAVVFGSRLIPGIGYVWCWSVFNGVVMWFSSQFPIAAWCSPRLSAFVEILFVANICGGILGYVGGVRWCVKCAAITVK